MYIGWILLIVFACILPIALTFGICFNRKSNLADTKYYAIKFSYYYKGDREGELEELRKVYDRNVTRQAISFIIAGIVGISLVACLFAVPSVYCDARNKYSTFIETQELVRVVYDGKYDEYENAGLNTKIVEVNQWLAEARASKKNWGICSAYYSFDLDSLDYIKLVKGESKT